MAEWSISGLPCISKPAVASFHPQPNPRERFDWQRADIFVRTPGNELWHTARVSRETGMPPETWCIPCPGAPLALALQDEPEANRLSILDVFVVDDEGRLQHKRLQPPPTVPYLREALGCLPLLSIFGPRFWCRFRVYRYAGWTSLGPCGSNPAAVSHSDGQLAVAVRRGGNVWLRHYNVRSSSWDDVWLPIPNTSRHDWSGDPVISKIGRIAIFTVNAVNELYVTTSDSSGNFRITPLGDAVIGPPAVLSWASWAMLIALKRDQTLQCRTFDPSTGWDDVWEPVGGDVGDEQRRWSTPPVALVWQSGLSDVSLRQVVFARDPQNELWFTYRFTSGLGASPRWTAWASLGGAHTADFSVTPHGVDQLAIYAQGRYTPDLYATLLDHIG